MAYKGRYKPKNPQKYIGDPTEIIYRSLLERRYMVQYDMSPNVLEWKSELTIIPYISPADGKLHRYFVDFWIKYKDNDKIKTAIIEVKPLSQTKPPKAPKNTRKASRRFLKETLTWAINSAKWEAADAWCKANKCDGFFIYTEKGFEPR